MVSVIERMVRESDNPKKSVYALARELSPKMGISEATFRNYLYAKREGYSSRGEYKRSFIRRKGFKTEHAYRAHLKTKIPEPTQKVRAVLDTPEPAFEERISVRPPRQIDSLAACSDCPIERIAREELIFLINQASSRKLDEKERRVIIGRFFEEKTTRYLANELNVSAMEICFTEKEALEKLRYALIGLGVRDCA